jgi:hypothetical protein
VPPIVIGDEVLVGFGEGSIQAAVRRAATKRVDAY